MKTKLLLAIVFILGYFPGSSQQVKVINSTEQRWSGGVAGQQGCNYTFTLSFSPLCPSLTADSIWIRDKAVKLTRVDRTANIPGNTIITHTRNSTTLHITAAVHYASNPTMPQVAAHSVAELPIPYKGIALLVYSIDGKRKYYTIKEIKKKYPHRSYP